MKKTLLILLISLLFSPFGFSQSLSLSGPDGPIANNGTVLIEGDVNSTLFSYIYVTNNSASSITVGVKKEHISVIPGTINTFCWGNCFDSSIYISPIVIAIAAGATNTSDFWGEYDAMGIVGKSTLKYTFYDNANPGDEVSVYVEYSGIIVGIDELIADIKFSEAYPNPASNRVSFNYSLPAGVAKADVIIRDILGNIVKQTRINDSEGKLVITTEDLTCGLYFYSVIVNDKIALSKKLVINR